MTTGYRRGGLSETFYQEMYAAETSYVMLHLLDVEFKLPSESVSRILHFVDDKTPLEFSHMGVTTLYQPAAFKINLGNDSADGTPKITLSFDSGDRTFIRLLRQVDVRPMVSVSVVMSPANKDYVVQYREIGPLNFQLTDFTFKSSAVTMNLAVEPILSEPVPSALFTPKLAPSLWADMPEG